ncbi:Enoyl-[acyl-carrier-protein] reductase [Minicystis rosea]|nr:Enoyl-[acyl-carrier-protein] reductase [Minicystis rosea]
MQSQHLLEHVRSVFVRMTRYPDEVVVADADLEQDLGIDSVKRGEILAALRVEFGLREALKATPDELRTVARVTDFLSRTLAARADSVSPSSGSNGTEHANGRPAENGAAIRKARSDAAPTADLRPVVVTDGAPISSTPHAGDPLRVALRALADTTRHPIDLLVPEARLEEDLGIDRRRRDDLHLLLQQRGALPDRTSLDRARTVGDLARLLGSAPPAPIAVERAPQAIAASALAGKTVLVTGASRGLGRVIATKLGRAGARVVVNSFHSRSDGEAVADEIRNTGGDAVHLWGSVANAAHIEKIFESIARDVGELHHFVSNASNGRFGPLEQTTPEHWELAFRTNVIGYHQCAIQAARMMERHGGGRIVALSSNGSSRYLEHFGAMGAVKAAVESLTRALAVELAPRNVQVNCVSAGPIYGHVTSNYPDHERILPYWESRTLGGQLCREEDVADAVLLLLSDGARMINGATLTVDGGGSLRI